MGRKPKFKPVITRIRLNPEQAVLLCDCYDTGVDMGSLVETDGINPGTQQGCIKLTKNIGYKGTSCSGTGSAGFKIYSVWSTKTAAS
jgi:hypothetical protein